MPERWSAGEAGMKVEVSEIHWLVWLLLECAVI
jgi:hypothetical protein